MKRGTIFILILIIISAVFVFISYSEVREVYFAPIREKVNSLGEKISESIGIQKAEKIEEEIKLEEHRARLLY